MTGNSSSGAFFNANISRSVGNANIKSPVSPDVLDGYFADVRKHKRLTREEESEVGKKMAESRLEVMTASCRLPTLQGFVNSLVAEVEAGTTHIRNLVDVNLPAFHAQKIIKKAKSTIPDLRARTSGDSDQSYAGMCALRLFSAWLDGQKSRRSKIKPEEIENVIIELQIAWSLFERFADLIAHAERWFRDEERKFLAIMRKAGISGVALKPHWRGRECADNWSRPEMLMAVGVKPEDVESFPLSQLRQTQAAMKKAATSASLSPRNLLKAHRDISLSMIRYTEMRDRMIQANLLLVVKIARRRASSGMSLSDLIQEGNIGLMRAVEKFDYRLGYAFCTYAIWWIRQGISRGTAELGKTIRIPSHIQEVKRTLLRAAADFRAGMDRDPTESELSELTGFSEMRVKDALSAVECYESIDDLDPEKRTPDNNNSNVRYFTDDKAVCPINSLMQQEGANAVLSAVSTLNERERLVITLRFGLGGSDEATLEDIGLRLGVTRERVRQIEVAAITKLKHPRRMKAMKKAMPQLL
ncbi:sigma-70 family RNA polymerase sigma factor [Acetobacter malorum]|uniref:sigma-70 family RNA polymerase sigma factor n=1 Tax=Acetobacter malorum TaxID=178901 RepID=UPI000777DA33|nr:sigma-70 family RNA polymerase sigma factor [Acetobacter malorum]